MPGADRRPAACSPMCWRRSPGSAGSSSVRISVEPGAEAALRPIAEASGLPVAFVPSAGDDHRQRLCRRGGHRGAAGDHHRRQCAADAGRGPPGRGAARGRRRHGGRDCPQGGRAQRPSGRPAPLLQVPRRRIFQLQPLRPLAPRPRARRDLPRGRPVRQESDADRARLRLSQPDHPALRPDLARRRDEASRPPLRCQRLGAGAGRRRPRHRRRQPAHLRDRRRSFSTGAPPEAIPLRQGDRANGRVHASEEQQDQEGQGASGARRRPSAGTFKIYRYDPDSGENPRYDTLRDRSRQLRPDGPRRAHQDQVRAGPDAHLPPLLPRGDLRLLLDEHGRAATASPAPPRSRI